MFNRFLSVALLPMLLASTLATATRAAAPAARPETTPVTQAQKPAVETCHRLPIVSGKRIGPVDFGCPTVPVVSKKIGVIPNDSSYGPHNGLKKPNMIKPIPACVVGVIACVTVYYSPDLNYDGWITVCYSRSCGQGYNCNNPSVRRHELQACGRPSYSYAYAGGYAKAGDACWGSPGTIGAWVGPTNSQDQVYNITNIQGDSHYAGSYQNDGWIYKTKSRKQYFQAAPGSTLSVSLGGGLIGVVGSSDQSNEIIEILGPTNPKIFDIQYSIILAVTGNYPGHYHTRSCFVAGWDGKLGA